MGWMGQFPVSLPRLNLLNSSVFTLVSGSPLTPLSSRQTFAAVTLPYLSHKATYQNTMLYVGFSGILYNCMEERIGNGISVDVLHYCCVFRLTLFLQRQENAFMQQYSYN